MGIGRFGPYVKWGDDFISIPRGTDMATVDLDKAIHLVEEKKRADAPIALYQGKPVTKGTGRFGPFIKWEGMFINVPKRYNFDHLSKADVDELIAAKVKKEANRYIHNWPEEKIAVENGRWGPFIRFGKKMIKLPRKDDDSKYSSEDATSLTLDDVKRMIEIEVPGAFAKKDKKVPVKKTAKKAVKKTSKKK